MKKKISTKNYIILGIIILLTVALIIYFYMWHNTYKESLANTNIMDQYLQVINYNELDAYLIENKDAIVYCSISENKEIRSFEKKFKNVIIKNSLKNEILYLDLTEEIKNKKINNELREKNIISMPSIIIYKDGNPYSIYDIKSNNYSIEKLKDYLKKEEIIHD